MLVACGLWFTWKTRGVQFRMIGEMIRLLAESTNSVPDSPADKQAQTKHISSFQAFAVMTVYRLFSGGVMVMFGALVSFELIWNIADFFMAFLTLCNLIAILILGKYAFRLLDDYRRQRRNGIKDPVFHRSLLPEIEDELECWD